MRASQRAQGRSAPVKLMKKWRLAPLVSVIAAALYDGRAVLARSGWVSRGGERMTGPLRIGVVGYGFMGRAHANAWRRVPNFFPDLARQPVLQAACGRDAGRVRAYADAWGFAAVETDWRALVAREDVDAVDVCVPNDLHAEIAVEALRRGKMVLCEKPLARSLPEAEAMVAAASEAGLPTMVWYNYRRVPAVSLAKRIVAEGRLGRVFHYRAQFLQDWTMSPELPQGGAALWRLDARPRARGHGRPAGALLRHGDVAERADRAGHGRRRRPSSRSGGTRRRGGSSRSGSTTRAW